MNIVAGDIVRWFCTDYGTKRQQTRLLNRQDEVLDALLDIVNAVEANSGHTGFNVAFRNDARSDDEIIAAIKVVIESF